MLENDVLASRTKNFGTHLKEGHKDAEFFENVGNLNLTMTRNLATNEML